MKKKLKKLSLKKEEIINLNDFEMNDLKGDGTWTLTRSSNKCLEFISIILTIAVELDVKKKGRIYDCEASEQYACGDGDNMDCVLSGMEIYP
jgi:natural product precursor